jgi:WD40 repeat protein
MFPAPFLCGQSETSFVREVAPILNQKCVSCHGAEKSKGGYRLDSFERLMNPGESQLPPVTARVPAKSRLCELITASDPDERMPQKADPLTGPQVAVIRRWIEQGAVFDGGDPKTALAALIPRAPYPDPPETYRFPIPVRALAFSPDGLELAVGGYHELTFWSASEGRLLRRVKKLPERFQSLAFSPDGLFLAAAGGSPGQSGEVLLFGNTSSDESKLLVSLADVPLSIAFSLDGSHLAAGCADGTIRLYEMPNGREVWSLPQHADWVMALAFSPDGTQIASASRDRSARVFKTQTGELESTYMEHNSPVNAIAFAADGKDVFSAGRDKKIHLWRVSDAKRQAQITDFNDETLQLLVIEDQIFSAATDGRIRQHTAKDRKLVRAFSGHADRALTLAWHAPSHRLVTGSHDGEVRIWDTESGDLALAFVPMPGFIR